MGFLDIGSKKHQGQRRQEHLFSNDRDWVTFQRLTTYHLFWGSHFNDQVLRETFNWIYRKYASTNNNSSICWVFVVFSRKVLQADSRINHLASKMCLEPCWINVRELKIWGRERVRVRDLTWSFWACSEKKKDSLESFVSLFSPKMFSTVTEEG